MEYEGINNQFRISMKISKLSPQFYFKEFRFLYRICVVAGEKRGIVANLIFYYFIVSNPHSFRSNAPYFKINPMF